MAGVDHTTIVWKDGVYIPDPFEWDDDGNLIKSLPFEYGRDGNIILVQDPAGNTIDITDDIKWYRHEYDALYYRDGCDVLLGYNLYGVRSLLKWWLHRMKRVCYQREVGVWKRGNQEVYIYHEPLKKSYASFYKNGDETYVVLGGYGHWENVYCHFMHRGYGETFERDMASEAFHWLCDDVLETVADIITEDWDESERLTMSLRDVFHKNDSYGREY